MDDIATLVQEVETHPQIIAALKAGASPNITIHGGCTALMYICDEYIDPDIAKQLLEHGAEVDARDGDGATALLRFIGGRPSELVWSDKEEALLRSQNDPLGILCVRLIDVLLEYGTDVNAQDNEGTTALMTCAMWHNRPFFIWKLLEAGADPDICDNKGHSALTRASEHNSNREVLTLLADLTSKVLPIPNDGVTPMIAAINSTNVNAINVLMDAGYRLEVTPPFRHLEPIMAAITGNIERLAESLYDGGSLEAKTDEGRTPLIWAAHLGHIEMVRYLLEARANVEAIYEWGKTFGTALFAAVEGNQLEMCKLLLESGAKPVIHRQCPQHIVNHYYIRRQEPLFETANVLELALSINNYRATDDYRELCLYLWEAVEDKSGVDMLGKTAVEFSKIRFRKKKRATG